MVAGSERLRSLGNTFKDSIVPLQGWSVLVPEKVNVVFIACPRNLSSFVLFIVRLSSFVLQIY